VQARKDKEARSMKRRLKKWRGRHTSVTSVGKEFALSTGGATQDMRRSGKWVKEPRRAKKTALFCRLRTTKSLGMRGWGNREGKKNFKGDKKKKNTLKKRIEPEKSGATTDEICKKQGDFSHWNQKKEHTEWSTLFDKGIQSE